MAVVYYRIGRLPVIDIWVEETESFGITSIQESDSPLSRLSGGYV